MPQQLQQELFQYHVLLEGMKEGIVAVDHSLRVHHINKSAGRFLQLNPVEVQGKSLKELITTNNPLLEMLSEILQTGQALELELKTQIPEEAYLQIRGQPLVTTTGSPSGAMLVISDVTRIRILEDHRRAFVSNVSHELKTPLTNIQGFVETLLSGAYKKENELLRFLNIIAKHSQRLGSIIEDLLMLSKLENESAEEHLSVQKIKPILARSYDSVKETALEKKIDVSIRCEAQLEARVNLGLLEQAIINLLDNAIKYSGECSKVILEAENKDESVEIRVRDNGPGIEEEHLERLFERFYRVDKARSRQVGGTGLGLSIVKHIAIVHKGQVKVESQVGHGSCFIISLPRI